MKVFKVIIFSMLIKTNFAQVNPIDTLIINSNLIVLENLEIIEPGKLPVNTELITYSFFKVSSDTNLILVKGKYLNTDNYVLGYYRRIEILANDGITKYYSWERDLLWIDTDSTLNTQNLYYDRGILINEESSEIIIKYE